MFARYAHHAARCLVVVPGRGLDAFGQQATVFAAFNREVPAADADRVIT